MRVLKIFLVALISSLAFVACDKTNVTPCNKEKHEQTKSDNNEASTPAARSTESIGEDEGDDNGDNGVTIVGSGDDDRNGGDKKQKKSLPK